MFETFLIHAWLAGLGISLMTGSLGCFIAWQRLSYFGDTVAHAAMLGVVLALLFGMNTTVGVVAIGVLIALIVSTMHDEYTLHADSVLGIAAHGALALALVILSLSRGITLDINGLLFGDILAVSKVDLLTIYGAAIIILGTIIMQWKPFMRFVIHADIAKVEGQNTARTRMLLMLLIALVVAISIKLVGILLITSLLIIPAASARFIASSPTQMAVFATIASVAAVTIGLIASLHADTPTGPSIILAALALLSISWVKARLSR